MSISCLFSFPKEKKTVNAKFDSSVKRLLCLQRKQLVVYDLPTLQHPIVNRNVILTAPNFSAKIGTDPFGFAGLNDDLVISALKKRLSRECRFCPANVWTVVSRHYHPRQRVHKRLWTTKVQHWLVKSGPAYATLNFKVI